jgi:hypothetical protein
MQSLFGNIPSPATALADLENADVPIGIHVVGSPEQPETFSVLARPGSPGTPGSLDLRVGSSCFFRPDMSVEEFGQAAATLCKFHGAGAGWSHYFYHPGYGPYLLAFFSVNDAPCVVLLDRATGTPQRFYIS